MPPGLRYRPCHPGTSWLACRHLPTLPMRPSHLLTLPHPSGLQGVNVRAKPSWLPAGPGPMSLAWPGLAPLWVSGMAPGSIPRGRAVPSVRGPEMQPCMGLGWAQGVRGDQPWDRGALPCPVPLGTAPPQAGTPCPGGEILPQSTQLLTQLLLLFPPHRSSSGPSITGKGRRRSRSSRRRRAWMVGGWGGQGVCGEDNWGAPSRTHWAL